MNPKITISDIRKAVPVSQGSTEKFFTGHWSSRKPAHLEKTSPCRSACPIGVDMARAFNQALKGDYNGALRIVLQDNPLPGICGRVCYHPCESSCNRREFDEAINIRGFERFLSDNAKVDIRRDLPVEVKEERICVIGSGPAGLGAAYHLARIGYPVTILEALPEPGGMLRYGIPEYRLPLNVLHREIEYVRQLGVEIRTGSPVDADTLSEIRNDYQAVFMAIGAHRAMRLGVGGEELSGVIDGVQLLRRVRQGEKLNFGQRVAVIGGGNTAVDCARTAKRMGGKEVSILYRRSREEMPAIPEDISQAEKEGITIHTLAGPARIISIDGGVGLECIRMAPGEQDSSGRARPVPVAGSEYVVALDMVITAVGQMPEAEFASEAGISLGRTGVLQIKPGIMATSMEGVFAGGDGAGERAFVADAIASGKMGAFAIYCYLEGKDIERERDKSRIGEHGSVVFQSVIDPENYPVDTKKIVNFESINTLCFKHSKRNNNPVLSSDGFGETIGGLDSAVISPEVNRCFKCGVCTQCRLCYLLCPDIAVKKTEKGYTVDLDYCKGCGQCAATCPGRVIEMVGKA
jgi:NADPH-dependent glutamate synthase beta subunit-like oxidoreductase/Pyruvate/2-oxoacid:ferredoxin oxidoreductase delta subunit